MVLARYAGDMSRRLDLAPLTAETSVAVDLHAELAEIDNGPPERRSRAFANAFPRKTTILQVTVPNIHDTSATLIAWIWDARAWDCWLPGKADHITLSSEGEQWHVTSLSVEPNMSLVQDCE